MGEELVIAFIQTGGVLCICGGLAFMGLGAKYRSATGWKGALVTIGIGAAFMIMGWYILEGMW